MRIFRLGFILLLLNLGLESKACPVFLFIGSDLKELAGTPKANLHLIAVEDGSVWREKAVQVDSLDPNGGIIFGETKLEVAQTDRLIFNPKAFGRKKPSYLDFPCKPQIVYEAIDYLEKDKAAYLISCPDFKAENTVQNLGPQYSAEQGVLFSENYSYKFDVKNQLLFEQIALGRGQDRILAAFHSDMAILADVKKFFSVIFNSTEIQSKIISMQHGPVGVNTNLSFFLNMFFFKISLSLSTDVSFYQDSAYLPMVLYFPVSAESYLYPSSGLLYHWRLSEKFDENSIVVEMPDFSVDLLKKLKDDKLFLDSLLNKHCKKKSWCEFSFTLLRPSQLRMTFRISRDLVAQGFLPIFVKNVDDFKKETAWDIGNFSKVKRSGFFFSTMSLAEGFHSWDFWLQLGNVDEKKSKSCPYPISLNKLAALSSPPQK